jgi:ABC-type Mn2+/Zn2+ transport system ATPase subunit
MTAKNSTPYIIDIADVSVRFGHTTALEHANLRIEHGTFSGVVGMNGAGKSTLFRTIIGLIRPTSGTVRVCGMTPQDAQKHNYIAYMPQSEQVDWTFPVSVYDVVMMGRYGTQNMFRIANAEDKEIVQSSLERVGMYEFHNRQIGELSGGQKKRVFLARALAQNAQLLLLDEPFAGVDAKNERTITQLLLELRDEGKTIILSTHELTSLSEYCDHVALVKKTILAYGPIKKVFTRELVEQTYDGAMHHIKFS